LHHCHDGQSWKVAREQVKKFFLIATLVITLVFLVAKFVMDAIIELEDED
jgi:hypothetical protein